MNPLIGNVKSFLEGLVPNNDTVVVAVSGGADSVALLRALVQVHRDFSIGRIGIAHLNHQLRGADSDEDEAFVHDLHRQLDQEHPSALVCHSERIDVGTAALAAKESIETAARRVRYQWLTRLAHKWNARWVATGHTADDRAETVLHRIIRGTGIKGLRGIPAQRPLAKGVDVIRPLLTTSRAEVLAFLKDLGQTYRSDKSNVDCRFTRNRIRAELLPMLQQFNPAIVPVLGRLADQAQELHQAETEQAVQFVEASELPRAGDLLIFNHAELKQLSPGQIRLLFRFIWDRENWPQQEMGHSEWQRIVAAVRGDLTAVDLPKGMRLRRRGRVIQLGRNAPRR